MSRFRHAACRPTSFVFAFARYGSLAALLLLTACSPTADEPLPPTPPVETGSAETAAKPGLRPLPALDLSATDEQARKQLEDQRALIEELLQDPAASGPARAEAFGQLSRLYITYELLDSAEVALKNARYLDPDEFRWSYLAGYVTALRGYPQEATAQMLAALELRPDYLPALLRIGRNELELGRNASAKQYFEEALQLDEEIAAAHEGLGRIAAAAGDKETAVLHLERALRRDPQASAVHYALGQVYRDLGNFETARFHLERSGDVLTHISDPLIEPLAELAANVQFYLVQGAEAIDNGDFLAAVAAYRAGLAQDAASLAAARGLAVSLNWLGDYEGALQGLLDAIDRPPSGDEEPGERAQLLGIAGDLALELGREPEAIELFLRSLRLEKNQLGLLVRTADALSRQARFAEALDLYERVLEIEPRSAPMILERRAVALINLDRSDQARAEFEEAVRQNPDSARLRIRFAEALDHLGDPEAAAAQRGELRRLEATEGNRARIRFEEGRLELTRGRYERAVDRFRAAVQAEPEFHEARLQLARVLGHLGRYDEAVAELEQVIEAVPRHAQARRDQIVALVFGGRYGETRVKLQEALREFPRDSAFASTQIRLLASAPDPRVRDGALALQIADRIEPERQSPEVRQAVALALAQAGRHEEGAAVLRSLLNTERERLPTAVAELWQAQLASMGEGASWVAHSPEEILLALRDR